MLKVKFCNLLARLWSYMARQFAYYARQTVELFKGPAAIRGPFRRQARPALLPAR